MAICHHWGMTSERKRSIFHARRDVAYVLNAWRQAYFERLDMLPVSCRRRVPRYEMWLGLALFLPSYLYVLSKLLWG